MDNMPLANCSFGSPVARLPVREPPSSSQIKAKPEPLCSPIARIAPEPLRSVVGASGPAVPYNTSGSEDRVPFWSIKAPSGKGFPPLEATRTLPSATTDVAKSKTTGGSSPRGTPTQKGAVEIRGSVPPKGATRTEPRALTKWIET